MVQDQSPGRSGNPIGNNALILGVVAIACMVIPIIGDFVTVPVAATAITLGLIGLRRHETGRASGALSAVFGVLLGLVALAGALIMFSLTFLPT